MKVGLVGLGKMGCAIAARLVELDFSVIGWDAEPARLIVLGELGQATAQNAAAVAADADQ